LYGSQPNGLRKEVPMQKILDTLTNASIMELAEDPRVLFAAAVIFVLALLFRWKYILLFLVGVGGTVAVIRYTNATGGDVSLDKNLLAFAGGTLVVAVVLIYFLFIRGD
jgi:hypothetical protein